MRRFTAALIAVLLLFTVNAYGMEMSLYYDGGYHNYISEDVYLNINGKKVITKEMPPIILSGRTLVPVREVFESIGGKVEWVGETGQVRILYSGRELLFTLDSRTIYVDGSRNLIATGEPTPMLINGKTMVPIRVVSDLLGLSVDWDNDERTVYLRDINNNVEVKPPANRDGSSGQPVDGMISDISIEKDGDLEYVYLTFGAPVEPEIYRYNSPERVVMDFDAAQLSKGMATVEFKDGDIITSVRGANHDGMARIVLDVKKQPNIGVYRTTDGIVIAASPAGSSYTTGVDDLKNGTVYGQENLPEPPAEKDTGKDTNKNEDNVTLNTDDTVDTTKNNDFDYKTVVIDPGHGGKDPGTVNGGVDEKDVALAISLLVRDKLEKKGYNVVMTRDSDTYTSLQDRVVIASKGTDGKKVPALFVSIHCNSVENNTSFNGTQVYYHPGSKYGTILAENIYNSNVANTTLRPAKVHDGSGLFVIRKTVQPAALVETAFLSNDGDREYLTSEKGQNDMATGIVEGIIQTMDQMKKDNGI